ncbi:hypothetical protein [Patulibacter sp.]|uniref:hypothetical protein n=1 Tax=Patulibacter sp. TaxID=1912859 RepID=UPI00271B3B21|nr:hypothetical protein [Patulibacter sp.]MDO9407086.1 hypothetical protein [Patulibacter sp.]
MDDQLARYEVQFRRAGLPLFIEDWSARTDAFNRAFPLLALVFVLELLGALNLDWPVLLNLAAVAGAVAFAGTAVALANRRRGRRALAVPEDLGPAELAGFVLVPAALPLLFNGQLQSAVVTAVFNLFVLGVVALGFGFGIGAILVWAFRRLAGQLAQSVALLARALPLLLLFAVVLFINTEMWQVFGEMEDVSLLATGGLLFLVVLAFLAVRIPREVRVLEAAVVAETGRDVEPLRRPQRANVGLVMLISHGLQVLVVTVAISAFFVALGMLVIGPEVTESWIGTRGEVVAWSPPDIGVPVRITHELLRVSAAIGALSGLYYAISVLTDSAYREEFLDELTDQMARTFEARSAYLALLAERRGTTDLPPA